MPSSLTETTGIDQQRAIDLLHGLVSIQSHSGQEYDAVRYFCEGMEAFGLATTIDSLGNAVGRTGSGPVSIVLLGHIDTVPGEIPVRIENGVLHGRGAVDAKGPLATFAAAAAAANGINATITVVGAVGEESIGSIGANAVKTWPAPDYCIIGEPSGWDAVCLGYRGTISFDILVSQDSRHSAGPGETVAELAVHFWNALLADIRDLNVNAAGFQAVGTSLRTFTTSGDGMQDEARLSIGVRLPPHVPSSAVRALIEARARDHDLVYHGIQEGYQTDKRNPLTAPFLRSIRSEGGTPRLTRKLGTSDMTVVGPVWQCPIVAYGPGDSALDHTPHECIDLDEYLRSIRILTSVLNAL